MIGFDPHTRRPGPSVPTHRGGRVAPAPNSGQTGRDGDEQRALVPIKSTRAKPEAPRARSSSQPSSATRSAASALSLQCDAPAPRRGLRADAVERRRYRDSYESAARPAPQPVRPTLVRCA